MVLEGMKIPGELETKQWKNQGTKVAIRPEKTVLKEPSRPSLMLRNLLTY